jgi:hypothetical protein
LRTVLLAVLVAALVLLPGCAGDYIGAEVRLKGTSENLQLSSQPFTIEHDVKKFVVSVSVKTTGNGVMGLEKATGEDIHTGELRGAQVRAYSPWYANDTMPAGDYQFYVRADAGSRVTYVVGIYWDKD